MKLNIEVLKTLISHSSLDYRRKNITGECPYCGFLEFGISVDENHRFGCFRKGKCGETGNIFKLLKKVNRLDLLSRPDSVTITSNYLEDTITKPQIELHLLPEIKEPIGFRRIFTHPYLESRGFKELDYEYYQVGITKLDSKLRDYVIFLIKQDNKLVGYVGRHTKSKEEIKFLEEKTGKRIPRYKNSTTDFESILLGYDECTENTTTVILVEGLMGKRNVDEKFQLHSQEQIKCLCTFGAKISETQLILLHLKGIRKIILCYDPDVVGYIKKYSARLHDEFESVRVALIPWQGKDPADLTYQEFEKVWSNLKSVLDFQLNVVQVLNLK